MKTTFVCYPLQKLKVRIQKKKKKVDKTSSRHQVSSKPNKTCKFFLLPSFCKVYHALLRYAFSFILPGSSPFPPPLPPKVSSLISLSHIFNLSISFHSLSFSFLLYFPLLSLFTSFPLPLRFCKIKIRCGLLNAFKFFPPVSFFICS